MTADGERERLRQTFDRASGLYQRARPEYPDELIAHLVAVTGLSHGDRLLEVGCATGKATLPLARRRFRITCIELGSRLAAVARYNLADFGDVEVVDGRFEDWPLPPGDRFDLVFAALGGGPGLWAYLHSGRRVPMWALQPGRHRATLVRPERNPR